MSAPFRCLNCGADIHPGMPSCNSCGTPVKSRPNKSGKGGFCSNCGSSLVDKHSKCPNCGHAKTAAQQKPAPTAAQSRIHKSENTAILLALLPGMIGLLGMGHLYIGKIGMGIIIFVLSFILFVVGILSVSLSLLVNEWFPLIAFLIPYSAVLIWSVLDAQKRCRKYNEHVRATGAPPH